jgi:hypothetical protein
MEHFSKADATVRLTGQLSTDVILVGDPANASKLSDGRERMGIFIAGDDLMGLLVFERDGAAIEMKERMLRGEARIDSGEGRDDKLGAVIYVDAVDAGDWPGSGSITQLFFNMAGSNFFSIDLVFPLRSRTGKAKQGSISASRQFLMNS